MSIIHSEEFIKAVSHFVEMCMADVQWKTDYTNGHGVMAAGNLADRVDEYCASQSAVHKKRIAELEESLRELLGAVHNIEVPQGGLDGFDWLIEAAEKADYILQKP